MMYSFLMLFIVVQISFYSIGFDKIDDPVVGSL